MPWTTPTLKQVRQNSRDYIMGALRGADAMVPNSVLRVMSDGNAGLAHLNLQFVEWLALQLLPITSETVFLDRWANMYLVNADSSRGRKQATFASGSMEVAGLSGIVIPAGSQASNQVTYQTTEQATIGDDGTVTVPIVALTAGSAGNLDPGTTLRFAAAISSVQPTATVVSLEGGTDTETDDELRARLLERLANPPMGGDAEDYVAWAMAVPGVTRAWSAPNEIGIGTVTLRFMMDDLRADQGGFPTADDIAAVAAYLNDKRPVAVKDFFVEAPLAQPISFTIRNLDPDTSDTWASIIASVKAMLRTKARPAYAKNGVLQPAQTIFAAWVSDAILTAPDVVSFDLDAADFVMPNNGSMAVLGDVIHG